MAENQRKGGGETGGEKNSTNCIWTHFIGFGSLV